MISLEEAYKIIETAEALSPVNVKAGDSLGMVIAEDIVLDVDVPPYDKAVMDGFAVRAEDTKNAPVKLKIVGESKAGAPFRRVHALDSCLRGNDTICKVGEAVRIMTGAEVPSGADAVVKVEETVETADGYITILTAVRAREFITGRGEIASKGEVVLKRGFPIRAAEIGVLACAGKGIVSVFRRPSVSIATTGDELVIAENPLPDLRHIRDCNSPMLISLLRNGGFDVNDIGITADDPQMLKTAINDGLASSDVLILSGGVSAGRYDLVPAILSELGVEKIFHKVNIKPGKPVFYGRCGQTHVFGLPGNPVSILITFKLLVEPLLKRLMGWNIKRQLNTGTLASTITREDLREEFIPVNASLKDGVWFLFPISSKGSADIFSLAHANAFAIIPPDVQEVKNGSCLEFFEC